MNPRSEEILKKAKLATYLGYSSLRCANFALQGSLLPLIERLATHKGPALSAQERRQQVKQLLPKMRKLLELDAQEIAAGVYPQSVLLPENPITHSFRIPVLASSAFFAAKRRISKHNKDFDSEAKEYFDETPDYYHRNFHFQENGYLSEESANLYDHQVEVLFAGTADPMRRQIIPSLKKHFPDSDGTGLKFLEVGAGTGALTRFIALTFPKANITCVDLSPHYLKKATQRLSGFERIDFVRSAAENLPFKDETFDAVFSCYLFHELPKNTRTQVIEEGLRVLKPGGYYGAADSIQHSDDPELDWALSQFPMNYHEPFFSNYIKESLEKSFEEVNIKDVQAKPYFFTKVVSGKKSAPQRHSH